MSDQLRESLSAVLDDAADEFELRRVLDETSRNDALRDTFGRYQLIKSTLRGEASAETLKYRTQLQRRVREAFDEDSDSPAVADAETVATETVARSGSGWGARALVAAVAFIAVIGAFVTSRNVDQGESTGGIAVAPVAVETTTVGQEDTHGSAVDHGFLPEQHDDTVNASPIEPDLRTSTRHDALLRQHFSAGEAGSSLRNTVWLDRMQQTDGS